ncbi:MAG: ketopantoate reductase family protein [Solirubrobacteraceae bacterium]
MRFVIFGAGAVGGVVGARLHQSGHEVVLIARGAHLEAIRRDGLTLLTPVERAVLKVPVAADPASVGWSGDEVVMLATKSQDTLGALSSLRGAVGPGVAVVCLQNGVENERLALRLFEHVYGAVVMVPTGHLEPGVVEGYGSALSGMIDLGRYPHGIDERSERIAGALASSRFHSRPVADVMRLKHAKLLLNLGNAVQALCGPGERSDELAERARAEGRAALAAAGIEFVAEEVTDIGGRWRRLQVGEIDGRRRPGSSSWQSLQRGTGTIETDYLNGEIVLQGRLHGVPTPVNEALCRVAARVAREGGAPGSIAAEQVLAVAA